MSQEYFTPTKSALRKVENLCRKLLEIKKADNLDAYDKFSIFLENKEDLLANCGEDVQQNMMLFYAWQAACSGSAFSRPAPDLGCLMASIANSSLKYKQVNNFLLGGINNVSPALLLTERQNLSFWISTNEVPDKQFENFIEHLNRYLPNTNWKRLHKDEELKEPFIYLGTTFENLSHFPKNFFDFSQFMTVGAVLAPTSELSVQRYAFYRKKWIDSGLLCSILKMPTPIGPWNKGHTTLFDLGHNADNPVRMAEYVGDAPSTGTLDIGKCLELLESRHCKQGEAVDVSHEELIGKGQFNLSPTYYLRAGLQKKAVNGLTLRNRAIILRSQLARSRVEEDELKAGKEDSETQGAWAREVSLVECDPVTGFVDERQGRLIHVPFDRNSPSARYFLQPNDIIFSFRGTEKSVGQTGFVYETDGNSVAGLSMCIIRALPGLNPVWLFYYLRQPEVLDYIRSQAVGGTLVTVNASLLQDLPLVLPSEKEQHNILEAHEEMCKNSKIIAQRRDDNRKLLEKLQKNFAVLQKE